MFQWGMRQSAELENQMTSVERVVEYINAPQEDAFESSPGEIIFVKNIICSKKLVLKIKQIIYFR